MFIDTNQHQIVEMFSLASKRTTRVLAKSSTPQSQVAQRRTKTSTIEDRERTFEDKDVRDHDIRLALSLAKKLAVCIFFIFLYHLVWKKRSI